MRFKRRLSPEARVDLVPMIDVVFQLVIFFMVTSTFLMTPGINIVMPTSTTTEPVIMSKLVVTVSSQEEIYINRDRYSLAELDDGLSSIGEEMKEEIESVVLEVDADVPYELLIRVMDRLRKNGFSQQSFRLREDPLG